MIAPPWTRIRAVWSYCNVKYIDGYLSTVPLFYKHVSFKRKDQFCEFSLNFHSKIHKIAFISASTCCIKNREQQKGTHQCDGGALKVLGQNIEFKVPVSSNNQFFYIDVCYGDLLSMGGCTKLIYTISDEQL